MDTPESAEEGRGGQQGQQDGTNTPADLPPRQQRNSLPFFLFVTFMLFMLTNNRGEELEARFQLMKALDVLNAQVSDYAAWLNGTATNFSLPTMVPGTIPLVDAFMSFGSQLNPDRASYYSNLTGFWHGDLKYHNLTFSNISESPFPWYHFAEEFVNVTNMTALPELLGTWNWSNAEKATISIGDKLFPLPGADGNILEDMATIHGKVELAEPNTPEELRLDFDGVHFITNGSIYAIAEPVGHLIDFRLVPSLVPESRINTTAHVVGAELASRLKKFREKIDTGSLDQDALNEADEFPKTRCSFRLYGQLEANNVSQSLMQELEDEIDTPTGITTIRAPKMQLRGVLVSQNCGILYEIVDATGLKSQRLFRKITTYAGFAAIVYLVLAVLYLRQAARSSSAAGLSRVSRYSFLCQSLIDVVSFVGHITLAILADGRPSIAVLAPAALACMLFVREAQFSVLIGRIQAREDAPPPVAPRPAPAPAPTPPSETPAPTASATYPPPPAQTTPLANPTPTTMTPPAAQQPSFLRFLFHHIRTDPAARLWTMISLFLIVVFRVIIFLSLPLAFVGTLYSCMWLTQIYRSVRHGRSSGLTAEYLIGVTICRLYFAMYFLTCPKNVLDVEPRPWMYGVAVFMFLQVFTIMLQEHLSPTFFLGTRVIQVDRYDYHPPLPLPDSEAPEQTLGDCAICMDAILVDPTLQRRSKSSDGREKSEGLSARRTGRLFDAVGVVGVSGARKSYSLAPCHHLFHTACLERWLAIKNICPQCRRPLPPL